MPQLTRRRAIASIGLATVASGQTLAAASERLRIGMIGVRGMGFGHLRNLLQRKDVEIATICDVDKQVSARAVAAVDKARGKRPREVIDFRRVLDDKTIDAVVIATPHHWHVPIAVRALQSLKHVYLEKPGSHVFREGQVLVQAQRKYKRVLQHGTQMRSSKVTAKAGEILKSGLLGEIKMSKAWNCQRHQHRKRVPNSTAPASVNYDLWLGPAPRRPFNENRFHGNWNWYRDYGNGDIGGDGIHDLDMARWGLGVTTHPIRITAHGSRIDLKGEREYPDNMSVSYQYAEGKVLTYEDRGWTPYGNFGFDSGNAFYGTKGFMVFSRRGTFQVYLGRKAELGPGMKGGHRGHPEHLYEFIDAAKSRGKTVAPAEVAHLSCGLVHLGEVAYRSGQVLQFDPKAERITNSQQANGLLTKTYRKPWNVDL